MTLFKEVVKKYDFQYEVVTLEGGDAIDIIYNGRMRSLYYGEKGHEIKVRFVRGLSDKKISHYELIIDGLFIGTVFTVDSYNIRSL